MKSLGWANMTDVLIEQASGHRQTQKKNYVRTQGEDSHL